MGSADALYDAIESGDAAAIGALLEADRGLVEGRDVTPPPVHWAIFHDRPDVVEVLLRHGADIERRDQDRDATPLAYAIVYGRAVIARRLVAQGADLTGMSDLVTRGAAGEFDDYPDVASRQQFEDMAEIIEESENCRTGRHRCAGANPVP